MTRYSLRFGALLQRRTSFACAAAVGLGLAAAGEAGATLIWSSPLDGNANAVVGPSGTPGGSPTPVADKNGNPGGAVLFNGTSDFFTIVPPQTVFTAGSMSVWVNPTNFTNAEAGPMSVGQSGGGTDQYFTLHRAWRGDLDDGVARADVASNVGAPTGTWQHVVLTFAAQGNLRMYVDGVAQNEVQSLSTALPSYTFTHAWSLGTERTAEVNRFFAGALDDARVYDHELTAGEVSALFAAGPAYTVPEPGAAGAVAMAGIAALARRRRRG